jgi:hypothetical protein
VSSSPDLYLLAGPNGAGKTTFYEQVLAATGLDFINADRIAALRWPGDEVARAYDAAAEAAAVRERYLADRRSFITESVFSHPSKVDLVTRAVEAGYRVHLRVLIVPADLSVARVAQRVLEGRTRRPRSQDQTATRAAVDPRGRCHRPGLRDPCVRLLGSERPGLRGGGPLPVRSRAGRDSLAKWAPLEWAPLRSYADQGPHRREFGQIEVGESPRRAGFVATSVGAGPRGCWASAAGGPLLDEPAGSTCPARRRSFRTRRAVRGRLERPVSGPRGGQWRGDPLSHLRIEALAGPSGPDLPRVPEPERTPRRASPR